MIDNMSATFYKRKLLQFIDSIEKQKKLRNDNAARKALNKEQPLSQPAVA